MWAILSRIITWATGSGLGRFLTGIGIGVVTHVAVGGLITNYLNYASLSVGSMPSNIAQVLLLMGIGQYLTIVGVALLTRAAIQQAIKTFGMVSSSSP
jgi:ABC-type dipeptide/oligopeptide/nickel transport system permease component